MALEADDIDPAQIARARALLINGTHLSRPDVFAASMKAAQLMKGQGGRVVFDIDLRSAQKAGLQISSKALRLARQVIE